MSAVARFYEGLILPPAFAVGNSPYAGERLSSTTDPKLSTSNATLPVPQRYPAFLTRQLIGQRQGTVSRLAFANSG